MAFINDLQQFFSLATLPTIVGTAVYFGRKLETLDRLEQRLQKMDETTSTMRANIQVIANALIASDHVDFDGTLLKSYSPLSLTKEGLEYLQKVQFTDIFNEHAPQFFEYIKDNDPKTRYDVEQLAIKSVYLHMDSEFMQPVKVYLYNHPQDSLQSLAKVAGVFIREQYLSDHPEIQQ